MSHSFSVRLISHQEKSIPATSSPLNFNFTKKWKKSSSHPYLKSITSRKQDGNMPKPFGLEKKGAKEKAIILRFSPPPGTSDVFSHYQLIFQHPSSSTLNINRSINKKHLELTEIRPLRKDNLTKIWKNPKQFGKKNPNSWKS